MARNDLARPLDCLIVSTHPDSPDLAAMRARVAPRGLEGVRVDSLPPLEVSWIDYPQDKADRIMLKARAACNRYRSTNSKRGHRCPLHGTALTRQAIEDGVGG